MHKYLRQLARQSSLYLSRAVIIWQKSIQFKMFIDISPFLKLCSCQTRAQKDDGFQHLRVVQANHWHFDQIKLLCKEKE